MKPILRFTQFPVEFRNENRVTLLIAFQFPASIWIFLLEGHQDYDWMEGLAYARADPLLLSTPLVLNILSPRVGEGGYRAADFKDYASEGGSEVAEDEKASVSSRGGNLSAAPY